MQIRLQSVVPKPLEGTYSSESIWGKDIVLDSGKSYLVSADSGKGKSTLISYIFGLRQDFSGQILLDNRDVSAFNLNAWADLRTGSLSIVFQNLRLFSQLTAWENLMLKHRLQPHISEQEILDLCRELGILELKDKPVAKLSMGQQQRFALVRALVQPFKFLLLDEPFSHLDDKNRIIMESILQRYCKANEAGLVLTSLGSRGHLNFDRILVV